MIIYLFKYIYLNFVFTCLNVSYSALHSVVFVPMFSLICPAVLKSNNPHVIEVRDVYSNLGVFFIRVFQKPYRL